MRSILPLTLTLMITLAGCAAVPAHALRDDGLARLGETTRVGALTVTPRALIEDSRCPVNARCIWAGRAVIRADLAGGNWHETRALTLGERTTVHGIDLALTSISPGRTAGEPPVPQASLLFGFEGGR